MKTTITILSLLFSMIGLQGQIVINEVIFAPGQAVEIKNLGATSVDVSSLQLCTFPTYNALGDLTVLSGSLDLAPGELLVVSGHTFDVADGELGLYVSGPFGSSDNIRDYVEWGSTGHTRSSVAVGAGIWTTGDFVAGVSGQASIEYDGVGNSSVDWGVTGENSQGAENSNTGAGCEAGAFVVGGQNICEGGTATFQLILSGFGPWSFTYSLNGVVQDPETATTSPHPWMLTEEGTYSIMTVTDTECTAAGEGTVTVTHVPAPTGTLSGASEFCATDTTASLSIALTGQGPWTITYEIDGQEQPSFMVGSSPAIIPVESEGLYELTNITNNSCQGEATGAVQVNYIPTDGGELSYAGSTDLILVCADDDSPEQLAFDVAGSAGAETSLIVTDEAGLVLSIGSGPLDFEGSGAGVCKVWSISYASGLTGLEVGNTIPDDLDGCYGLSNSVDVLKETGDDCLTSLFELAGLSALTLFPNPAQDDLNVRFDLSRSFEMHYTLIDMRGQVLAQQQINGSVGQNQFSLDVRPLASGVYILSLQSEEGAMIQRRFTK